MEDHEYKILPTLELGTQKNESEKEKIIINLVSVSLPSLTTFIPEKFSASM